MDLIPKPDQVASAASNVAHKFFYGGLADLRPMPRTLIDDGPLREVYHYRPVKTTETHGEPILFVTPLAAPALCFDLRRGCSLVEHFVKQGRPTYLVEYGEVSFKDRNLGMEHWVEDVIPEAIKAVSQHAGGKPVHVVGWSLGGIFSVLSAADRPDLPIATVTAFGSPIDIKQVPLVAPLRPLMKVTDGAIIGQAIRLMGGAPKPIVKYAFQLSSFQKLVTKPLTKLTHLDDTEFLAQIEAVDRFSANMIAYPGRTFGQLYHRMLKSNQLNSGVINLAGHDIRLDAIKVPVLVFAGATDGIAPVKSVRALVPLLTGSSDVRFEIVPGGHLGMLTGRAARTTSWVVLDEWVGEHSDARQPRKPRKKATASAKKKEPAKKKAAKSEPPAEPVLEQPQTGDRSAIGSNPDRRFGSASSRNLARKPS